MAKKATTETDEGTSAVRSNGYDPDAVKRFVDRVELLEKSRETLKAAFKEETLDPLKEDIALVIEEADQAGIPKKELKAKIRERATHRKAEAIRGKLKEWEQDRFDRLSLALGELKDLPLGQSALAAAARNGSAGAPA